MTSNWHRLVQYRHAKLLALAAVALSFGACTHREPPPGALTTPVDYRQRHPIVVQEADQRTEIFVGSARGGLTAAQRADVGALGQLWLREGTGVIIAELPVGTRNARAAADTLKEIRSILTASGIPARGIQTRNYHPERADLLPTIRLIYPRLSATAGPCGTWPEDIGPSIKNKGYFSNQPYYNLGCASQRNLAAMIDNPSDLVQPRAESPAYTQRRSIAFQRYREGTSTTTTYPEANTAKISEAGK